MFNHLKNLKHKLRTWIIKEAHSKHAELVLGVVSFFESVFLPLPADVLLAPLANIRKNRWLRIVLITITTSVIGGIAGYFIGMGLEETLGQWIIEFYHLEESSDKVFAWFRRWDVLIIFVAAFTPIPYKVFTLSAGIAAINFPLFVLISFIGRGLRFLLVGWVAKKWGDQIGDALFKYFNIITLILVVVIALVIIFL